MNRRLPRLIIAGLSGDSGKTTVSLSVLTSLHDRGLTVASFKKGPDYIDSAWLSSVGGSACRNLDTFMVEREAVRERFLLSSSTSDTALIEGNRGIYDGMDIEGTHSTAELAKLLLTPVILVVDCTKTTRTIAAIIKGVTDFDSEVQFAGVVLNKLAGPRHENTVRKAVEENCDIPVVGAIRKLGEDASIIPGRHLGLVTPSEFISADKLRDTLLRISEDYLDIDAIIEIARSAEDVIIPDVSIPTDLDGRVKVAYFRDSVFTFYYPENLEALERFGADLMPVSSTEDSELPDVDALYIGGGFPETQAERLWANQSMMKSVKDSAERGLPIYAECGGLIYLCRSLEWQGKSYEMAGIFPLDLVMQHKPAGHGYMDCLVDERNPYFAPGTVLKGHEFHYTSPKADDVIENTCFKVRRGAGIGKKRDGLVYKGVLASYCHIHADGAKSWAESLIGAARNRRDRH